MMLSRVLVLCLMFLMQPVCLYAYIGDWQDSRFSKVRILSSAESRNFLLGIEVEIDDGWYMYSADPGDVGLPTQIDLSGSDNIKTSLVHWPVHEKVTVWAGNSRMHSKVYRGNVLIPISGTLTNQDASSKMMVVLRYGVCAEICIPCEVVLEGVSDRDRKAGDLISIWFDR